MSLSRVKPSPEDVTYLDALGIEWRHLAEQHGGTIPPIDDHHVRDVAGSRYQWALDKHAQIRNAGGIAALRTDPAISQLAGGSVVILSLIHI